MRSQDFLATVLPTSGNYCAVELSTAKREHVFVDSIDELYKTAIEFSDKGFNSYFALASFNEEKNRLAENAVKIKSLFIDIDCGEGKDYPTKKEAYEALNTFLATTSLAELGTPWILSSGGGLHIYWPFNEEVDIQVWKPVAENLKRLCKKEGFNIDSAVTGDAARVLRVPDTYNYKQEKKRKVKILVEANPHTFDFDTIAQNLREKMNGSAYEVLATLDIPGKRPKALPTANSVKLTENTVTFFKNIEGKCKQLAYYRDNAEQDGMEPLWRGLLSIAKYCKDGEEYAVELSDLHPYDHDRMNQKLHEIKGPYSCIKMDEINPGLCQNCPHFTKITNPLALGREVEVDNTERSIIIDIPTESEEEAPAQIVINRPTPPTGFSYGSKGGIFVDKMMEDEQGNKSKKQIMILPYDLFAVDILNNNGEHMVHMMAFRPEGPVDLLIPQKSVVSKDETVKCLASQNIVASYGSGNDKNLFEYVRGCVEHASANKVAVKIPSSCGWQSDNSFVYNSKVFYPDGKEVYVPTPNLDNINQATVPTGTLDNWKKVYNMLVAKQLWDVVTMSLVGPASVLMKFSGYRGCAYHLGSSESGTGKTLALELASSFWGHPELYRVTQGTSAVASLNRQGLLGSLPMITDEITAKSRNDFEWLPEFLLDLTQGKGKDRMEQGANRERLNTSTWNLLVLLSSNTHVFDYLSGPRKHASQAEMLRILELQMSKKIVWEEGEAEVMSLLKSNFGVIGQEFIRWLVANKDVAEKVFNDTREALKKEFQSNDDERYWTAGNSCIIAAVQLLGKKYANLIDIPIGPVIEVLLKMVKNARSVVRGSTRTAEDVLNAYTREYYGKFVVIKAIDGTLRATLGDEREIDLSITRSDIAGRVEHNITPGHVDYYIEEQLLKQHCVAMSFGYADFKKQIEAMPNYKVKYCRKDMLSKTRGPSMRVNAMQITRPIVIDETED